MRRNEANWRKWYLENMGRQWDGQNGATLQQAELSPRQRALGELLYNRYVQEKKAALDKNYNTLVARQAGDAALRNMAVADMLRGRYSAETNLALGQADSGIGRARQAAADNRYRQEVQRAQTDMTAGRDAIWRRYAEGQAKEDKQLAKQQKQLNNYYNRLDKQMWRELRQELTEQLPDYLVEGTDSYTQQGIEALRLQIEHNKTQLGNRYNEALQWLQNLSVYSVPQNYRDISDQSGRMYRVSDRNLQLSDAVKYKYGAGNKISRLDVLTVTYDGAKYYIRPDQKLQKKEQSNLLYALAYNKNISLVSGAVVYYDDKLYVYDAKNGWYSTTNTTTSASDKSLDKLLQRIQQQNK